MALHDLAWYVNYGNGSSTGYYGVAQFAATTSYTAGQVIRQLTTPSVGNERCFVCTTAGLTTTEPTWTVTRGALNTAGTAVFQECTGVPGLNGDTTNMPAWLAYKNANVTLGAVIYDSGTASLQICTVSGTAGNGSTPSFSTTAGTTTADNSATWTSLGLASGFTTAFAYPHARLANALATNWGAAGNSFAVSSIHAETQSSSISLTPPGTAASPNNIYCLSSTTTLASPTLASSASISTTGANSITLGSTGFGTYSVAYWYGIKFSSGSSSNTANISINTSGGSSNNIFYFDTCTFTLGNTSASSVVNIGSSSPATGGFSNFTSCTFVFGSTSQSIEFNGAGPYCILQACTFAASGSAPTTLFSVAGGPASPIIRDSDLSNITSNLCSVSGSQCVEVTIENCKLAGGVSISTGSFASMGGSYVKLQNCDSAGTNYRYYFANYAATVQQETTIVRTGTSATNGTTPISWNMAATANAKTLQPFVSDEIAIWNAATGSAMTATCYLTTSDTLDNSMLWIEIEYLSSASSPLGATVNSRVATLGTPATLTTDGTSSWGGSAQTNLYKITSPSFTPQQAGPIKMRVYVGPASTAHNIYVDPSIYLSTAPAISRSEFIPGWGYMQETGAVASQGYSFS